MEGKMTFSEICDYFSHNGFSEEAYDRLDESDKNLYLDIILKYEKNKESTDVVIMNLCDHLFKSGYMTKDIIFLNIDSSEVIHEADKELIKIFYTDSFLYETKLREVFCEKIKLYGKIE